MTEPTETKPRQIVPVLVVRVGTVRLVGDGRDPESGVETGFFDRSWRMLVWDITGR